MPETENLELRTDTVEQLIDLLESDNISLRGTVAKMPKDRRMAVAERLRSQISKPDAVALCGLPGAGKSHTAEKLSTVYDASVVSMGDAIRHEYKERNWLGEMESDVPDEIPSDKLGNFAAEWRAEAAEEIPEKVAEIAGEMNNDLIIIDGVRSMTDYEVLADYFDDFYLIEVQSDFYTRLSRLQDRGRDGEDSFDAVDLAERDIREKEELGFQDLLDADPARIDLTIENGTGNHSLTINLSSIVENHLPFEIQDGRPLGLSEAMEKFRKGENDRQDVIEAEVTFLPE